MGTYPISDDEATYTYPEAIGCVLDGWSCEDYKMNLNTVFREYDMGSASKPNAENFCNQEGGFMPSCNEVALGGYQTYAYFFQCPGRPDSLGVFADATALSFYVYTGVTVFIGLCFLLYAKCRGDRASAESSPGLQGLPSPCAGQTPRTRNWLSLGPTCFAQWTRLVSV